MTKDCTAVHTKIRPNAKLLVHAVRVLKVGTPLLSVSKKSLDVLNVRPANKMEILGPQNLKNVLNAKKMKNNRIREKLRASIVRKVKVRQQVVLNANVSRQLNCNLMYQARPGNVRNPALNSVSFFSLFFFSFFFYFHFQACVAGKAGTPCENCLAGRFRSSSDSQAEICNPCGVGKFQKNVGQGSCLPCIPGEYNDQTTGVTQCKPCAANSFNGEQQREENCVNCPAGWSSEEGSTKCQSCEAGMYSNEVGVACGNCVIGMYRQSKESDSTGTFLTDKITDPTKCVNCPAGWESSEVGSTQCLSCEAGKFSDSQGAACVVCASGKYRQSKESDGEHGLFHDWITDPTKCVDCPAGWSSVVGSTKCQSCEAGSYSNIKGQECKSCGFGQYRQSKETGSGNTTDPTKCVDCPAGWSSLKGSTKCQACEAGTFSNVQGEKCDNCGTGQYRPSKKGDGLTPTDPTTCVDCPIGWSSAKGSTKCQACGAGTYGNGCQSCPLGYARNGTDHDATQCRLCKLGETTTYVGAASCERW